MISDDFNRFASLNLFKFLLSFKNRNGAHISETIDCFQSKISLGYFGENYNTNFIV